MHSMCRSLMLIFELETCDYFAPIYQSNILSCFRFCFCFGIKKGFVRYRAHMFACIDIHIYRKCTFHRALFFEKVITLLFVIVIVTCHWFCARQFLILLTYFVNCRHTTICAILLGKYFQ